MNQRKEKKRKHTTIFVFSYSPLRYFSCILLNMNSTQDKEQRESYINQAW